MKKVEKGFREILSTRLDATVIGLTHQLNIDYGSIPATNMDNKDVFNKVKLYRDILNKVKKLSDVELNEIRKYFISDSIGVSFIMGSHEYVNLDTQKVDIKKLKKDGKIPAKNFSCIFAKEYLL